MSSWSEEEEEEEVLGSGDVEEEEDELVVIGEYRGNDADESLSWTGEEVLLRPKACRRDMF